MESRVEGGEMKMPEIWFWQCTVSPHMSALASALARRGCGIKYIAEGNISSERTALGWQAPELPGVTVLYVTTEQQVAQRVESAPAHVIHLCQGIRGNGLVSTAQRALAARGRSFWVIMETVEANGLRGIIKKILYRRLFYRWRNSLRGVLAIGRETPDWVQARGVDGQLVFPFTYFLAEPQSVLEREARTSESKFQVLFVGQFIERKRLDLLISALAEISEECSDFLFRVIGAGPLEKTLRAQGEQMLGHRLDWLGQLPMHEVRRRMEMADCLVLPSRHDGWGAVVSEALMAGTPVICSDRCGAAEAVVASGKAGLFTNGDQEALKTLLKKCIQEGKQTPVDRIVVARWAQSLGAEAGAQYLLDIISYHEGKRERPPPPWRLEPSSQQR